MRQVGGAEEHIALRVLALGPDALQRFAAAHVQAGHVHTVLRFKGLEDHLQLVGVEQASVQHQFAANRRRSNLHFHLLRDHHFSLDFLSDDDFSLNFLGHNAYFWGWCRARGQQNGCNHHQHKQLHSLHLVPP